MNYQEHCDKIFRGIHIFDSSFISSYFDEEDQFTFRNYWSLKEAYSNVRNWLKYAVIKPAEHSLPFGKYQGMSPASIVKIDAQYIEYCIREVDRFYLEESFIVKMIEAGYRFNDQTVKAYRQKLADLMGAIYLEDAFKNYQMRLDREQEAERDKLDDDWLSHGQWESFGN